MILLLNVSIILYVAFLSALCFLKYRAFAYWDFDLAVHSQIMWNILHGSLYNSILGINFLGNHVHPITFLLAPFYKLFPHPCTLLFLQSLALGAGAYPLYYLARLIVGYRWALLIALLYLINPLLGFINLYEFHPIAFSTFFLLCTLYYFQKNQFRNYLLCMILAMSCQENISLAVIALGFYALLKRKKRAWIITPIVLGVLYFCLCIFIILPYCNKGVIEFISIYSQLGDSYSSILIKIITHPGEVIKVMFTGDKIKYLNELFSLFIYIPLLSPLSILPALPFFLQHLLSNREAETMIFYHYTAEIVPFLFFAYINGIKKIASLEWVKKNQAAAAGILFLSAFASSTIMGPYIVLLEHRKNFLQKTQLDLEKDLLLKEIPPDAPIVATFEFLSHLAHRKSLYSFHHVYIGTYTISSKKYLLPPDAQYALIDSNDHQTFYAFLKQNPLACFDDFINSGNWKTRRVINNLILFQKGEKDAYPLYDVLKSEPAISNVNRCRINSSIEFLGHETADIRNNYLNCILYWSSTQKTSDDIDTVFTIMDASGKLIASLYSPLCYRILPSYLWKPNSIIKEYKYIKLPEWFSAGKYVLSLKFFNRITDKYLEPSVGCSCGSVYLTDFTLNE
ncbi:MAG: DUF2079 domain-containing protein [Candidatus Omnitrophota bacterium]